MSLANSTSLPFSMGCLLSELAREALLGDTASTFYWAPSCIIGESGIYLMIGDRVFLSCSLPTLKGLGDTEPSSSASILG